MCQKRQHYIGSSYEGLCDSRETGWQGLAREGDCVHWEQGTGIWAETVARVKHLLPSEHVYSTMMAATSTPGRRYLLCDMPCS